MNKLVLKFLEFLDITKAYVCGARRACTISILLSHGGPRWTSRAVGWGGAGACRALQGARRSTVLRFVVARDAVRHAGCKTSHCHGSSSGK